MQENMLSTLKRHGLMAVSIAILVVSVRWGSAGLTGGLAQFVDGLWGMLSILSQMFPPNFAYLGRVSGELAESLYMAILSSALAVGIAALLSWVRRAFSLPLAIAGTGQALWSLIAAVPALVWAAVLVRGLGAGPVSGVTALTLYALSSTSAHRKRANAAPVTPETTAFLDFGLICLDMNTRLSVVVGLVGAGGIGELLYANVQFQLWPNVSLILAGIALMVVLVGTVGERWRVLLVRNH